MTDIKYHVFKVDNYKGGVLRTYVNLSKERFIDIILDNYIEIDSEYSDYSDILQLSEYIMKNISEFSIYAGGDSDVAEFFSTDSESSNLECFELEDFINDNIVDIVKYYCVNECGYELTEDDVKILNNAQLYEDSKGIEINNSRNIPLV